MATPAYQKLKPLRTVLIPLVLFVVASQGAESNVVINEIMYHPPLEMEELQYVELCNRGKMEVDVSGWSLAKGVKFKFPEKTRIAAGGYLVICRNREIFKANYGGVAAAGDW